MSENIRLLSSHFELEGSDRVDLLQIVFGAILLAGYYLIEIAYRVVYFIVHFWIVSVFAVIMHSCLDPEAPIGRPSF
ncbi:hypothetical protein [Bradyrhizobium arachidis]|uniref:Uncharacterized protein n=1 Tax=Bradyrhizobium arachidis TaxID=858423 RepID=A0AAE7NRP4_9BRAD|nr:hypothetical protein [Bradyrhizobium arachidis]QOZ69095.1 hypothetical protein WN72_24310 [Bradyrhizobium arachidis]SFV00600.1 hypothetical protein SAMN05192541_109237 [Bradyrhizobium arachidis]